MILDNLLELAIIGAALSLLYEAVQAKYEASKLTKKAIIIGASLLLGGIYYGLEEVGYIESAMTILAFASTVYAVFINR